MTMIQALRSAMDVMLERDDNVVVFGQDVGYFGGVFRCTEGLQAKYGSSRVFDAPISESGIVGAAVGMGAYGLRPVAEIQFADYFYPASDQIVSEAARLRYRSAGEFIAPMTLRMPCGGGIYGGQTHSQSPEAMFTQVCGLRTVMPSNPYDAKGLLIAAIENDDPVIFLEPKRLYNGPFDGHHERPVTPWAKHPASAVPDGYYTVPLDCAAIVRPGTEVTILTYGTTVYVAQVAAEETGIDAEVIDLRSLWPLDLVGSRVEIIGKLDFGDRSQTVCTHANGGTHNAAFGDGGVKHTRTAVFGLQTFGASEYATEIAHILAKHHHVVIALKHHIHSRAQGLDHRHGGGAHGVLHLNFIIVVHLVITPIPDVAGASARASLCTHPQKWSPRLASVRLPTCQSAQLLFEHQ